MTYTGIDPKCVHGLPVQCCASCSRPVQIVGPLEALEQRVKRLERLMEQVCPDKSED